MTACTIHFSERAGFLQRLAFLALCLTLLTACQTGADTAGSEPAATDKARTLPANSGGKLPPWVLSPPEPDRQFLYAIGTGQNLQLAREDGLAALASQLNVSVQSSFQQRVSERQRGDSIAVDAFAQKDLTTEVGALTLNNYRVVETSHDGRAHYALLRLNKPLLLRDLKNRLRDASTAAKAAFARTAAMNEILEKLKDFKFAADQAVIARGLAYYTIALDPDAEPVGILDTANRIEQAFKDFQDSFAFHVKGDPNCRPAGNYLRDELMAHGYRVLRDPRGTEIEIVAINLRGMARYVRSSQAYQVSLTTSIAIQTEDRMEYSANFDSAGSGRSRKEALQTACDAFIRFLDAEGALALIGIPRDV